VLVKKGRGFAVVAEEVGHLAAKSSQATKEIEQILKTFNRNREWSEPWNWEQSR